MSGIIGGLTAGRIAIALGTVGVGAVVGGAIADHNGKDVGSGALIGGLSAAAGLALLYGGVRAFQNFGRSGGTAATLAAKAGTTELSRLATSPLLTSAASGSIASAATKASTELATTSFFATRPLATSAFTSTIPAIARTPMLPVASPMLGAGGGTFVDALRGFLR